jgi:hypothetical protein
MALLAGAAYTWARSRAVIKTKRSDQDTMSSAERSDQVKRTKPSITPGLFFFARRGSLKNIYLGHPSSLVVLHVPNISDFPFRACSCSISTCMCRPSVREYIYRMKRHGLTWFCLVTHERRNPDTTGLARSVYYCWRP